MGAVLAVAALLLVVVVTMILAAAVVVAVRGTRRRTDRRPRAYVWAERRGVTLTERSAPFVDTYLHNARALRLVCAAGALVLLAAWTYGTGIDLGGIGLAWVLAGYLAGSVWAELSLARVPLAETREASLVVREPRRYQAGWVAAGQYLAAAGPVVLALVAIGAARNPSVAAALDWVHEGNVVTQAIAAGVLAALSLVVTVLAERHIVRRPQPRTEPDLVAADEAMRTSAVHQLGITHIVLCLLLALAVAMQMANPQITADPGTVVVMVVIVVIGVAVVWASGLLRPGAPGGPVPPPPFPPEAASAVDLTPAGTPTWTTPRRPDTVTLAVIGALAIGLWGLRWLGPTNPEIDAQATVAVASAGDGTAPYDITVTNRSRLPVEIHAIDTDASDLAAHYTNPPVAAVTDLSVVTVDGVASRVLDGGGAYLTRLPGGDTAVLRLTLAAPPCPPGDASGSPVLVFPNVLTVVTATGRWITVPVRTLANLSLRCTTDVPPGPQPADPIAARAAVEQAFTRTYAPPAEQVGPVPVDRPEGLEEVAAEARRGGMGPTMASTRMVLSDVRFDRADHAWVRYDFVGPDGHPLSQRRGEAVLVDGTWKVTRATVCADLSLVAARCPDPAGDHAVPAVRR